MKPCLNHTAALSDEDAVPASSVGKKKKRWLRKKEVSPISDTEKEPVDDGYDGYYDDVLPPDLDRLEEGLYKNLIRRIIILGVGTAVIIGLCIAMLYML